MRPASGGFKRKCIDTGRRLLRRWHVDLVRYPPRIPSDFEPVDIDTITAVRNFTSTSPERISALCQAVRYVVASDIPGALVECGVWKGGSMMAVARTLLAAGHTDRELYLFDTFEGMPRPTAKDVSAGGEPAVARWETMRGPNGGSSWSHCSLEDVRTAVLSTGYDPGHAHFVKGDVLQTIPAQAPDSIALLRLDTDWYESTYHELVHLFPRLSPGGVLLIDDYGHWLGAREATDTYLHQNNVRLLLNRVDYTARIGVKSFVHL